MKKIIILALAAYFGAIIGFTCAMKQNIDQSINNVIAENNRNEPRSQTDLKSLKKSENKIPFPAQNIKKESTFSDDYPTQPKKKKKVKKVIVVVISQQKLYAFENNSLKYEFTVSTAITGHKVYGDSHPAGLPKGDIHDHIGTFYIQKKEPFHYSSAWQSNMYYPLWYIPKLGVAIHGTDEIEDLGKPASHGCVRLHPDDAKILYLWAEIGTPVIVQE